jgi:hypothetical protein
MKLFIISSECQNKYSKIFLWFVFSFIVLDIWSGTVMDNNLLYLTITVKYIATKWITMNKFMLLQKRELTKNLRQFFFSLTIFEVHFFSSMNLFWSPFSFPWTILRGSIPSQILQIFYIKDFEEFFLSYMNQSQKCHRIQCQKLINIIICIMYVLSFMFLAVFHEENIRRI